LQDSFKKAPLSIVKREKGRKIPDLQHSISSKIEGTMNAKPELNPLENPDVWEDDVLRRYPDPDSITQQKTLEEYRNYDCQQRDTVKEFYRLNLFTPNFSVPTLISLTKILVQSTVSILQTVDLIT
jgi:hypothetical protein